MPLWKIYHPSTTFQDPNSKSGLAGAVTKTYTSFGLPAFYVNVLFIPLDPSNIYVGGVARPSPHQETNVPGPDSSKPFIRITIENIARKIPNEERRERFLTLVDKALKPYIEDMGYDWEYNVVETPRELWKVQGLAPPATGSEGEAEWVKQNRAVPLAQL